MALGLWQFPQARVPLSPAPFVDENSDAWWSWHVGTLSQLQQRALLSLGTTTWLAGNWQQPPTDEVVPWLPSEVAGMVGSMRARSGPLLLRSSQVEELVPVGALAEADVLPWMPALTPPTAWLPAVDVDFVAPVATIVDEAEEPAPMVVVASGLVSQLTWYTDEVVTPAPIVPGEVGGSFQQRARQDTSLQRWGVSEDLPAPPAVLQITEAEWDAPAPRVDSVTGIIWATTEEITVAPAALPYVDEPWDRGTTYLPPPAVLYRPEAEDVPAGVLHTTMEEEYWHRTFTYIVPAQPLAHGTTDEVVQTAALLLVDESTWSPPVVVAPLAAWQPASLQDDLVLAVATPGVLGDYYTWEAPRPWPRTITYVPVDGDVWMPGLNESLLRTWHVPLQHRGYAIPLQHRGYTVVLQDRVLIIPPQDRGEGV